MIPLSLVENTHCYSHYWTKFYQQVDITCTRNLNFDSQFTVCLSRSGELNRGHVWLPLMLERIVGKLCTHKHGLNFLNCCSTLILITIDKARTAMKLCLEQFLSFSNICLLFVLHLKLLSD